MSAYDGPIVVNDDEITEITEPGVYTFPAGPPTSVVHLTAGLDEMTTGIPGDA